MKRFQPIGAALLLFAAQTLFAQAPVINSVTPNATTVQRFEKLELSLNLTAGYTNPYDYDEILVRGIFTAPSGKKDTVEGFYAIGFDMSTVSGNLSANGANGFRIRYAPSETGAYSYLVTCRNAAGSTATAAQQFQCSASTQKGFVRKGATNYLKFDNNEQFIPVGQNQAWQSSNKYLDYKNWTDRLSANGANFIRLWQCSWGLGIEWKGAPYEGLKRYRQDNSFYTDKLLDECAAKGIYVMFCINHHGMVSSNVNPNWPESPYNAANGGPCANTWDYFTNTTARNLHKNRLRYIMARWGYSRNIMSWELFNEVEWTDNFNTHRNEVQAWHKEMAAFLKANDPFRHLVTTSYANSSEDPNTWNLPEMDFTQTHFYVGSPNVETVLAEASRSYLQQFGKPTYNGEFGIHTENIDLSALDPNGIYIHNSVWATLFSGAMGAGASWWWDNYIDPRNLYFHYKAPALMTTRIALEAANFKPHRANVTGGGKADLTINPGGDWGKSAANAFTVNADGSLTPTTANLGKYLYGNEWNTHLRNPPTFTVNYTVAGEFKVQTGSSGTKPKINISLDGNAVLNVDAAANSTYTINVPAGAHTIKVDNPGTDWIVVNAFVFTNIGSPVNSYILRSGNNLQAAGWVHNKRYNWQEVKNSGIPAAVTGATLTIGGMANGTYQVKWYDCLEGAEKSSANITATDGNLVIPCPSLAWDAVFTAYELSTLGATPVGDVREKKTALRLYPNPVKESLLVNVQGQAGRRLQYTISNAKGQQLLQKELRFSGNDVSFPVALQNVAAGVYYFTLSDAAGKPVETQAFIRR